MAIFQTDYRCIGVQRRRSTTTPTKEPFFRKWRTSPLGFFPGIMTTRVRFIGFSDITILSPDEAVSIQQLSVYCTLFQVTCLRTQPCTRKRSTTQPTPRAWELLGPFGLSSGHGITVPLEWRATPFLFSEGLQTPLRALLLSLCLITCTSPPTGPIKTNAFRLYGFFNPI